MSPPPTNDDRRLVGAARDEFVAPGVTPAQVSGPGEMAGDVIHRYTLVSPLGEGGMGTVWLARQSEPVAREVALKIVKLGMDTREVVARFEAERQALALMDHQGIAKVLDGGATDSGRPYFVMEHVDGARITDHCDSRRMDVTARLALFVDVCEAVHHAHQKGVIHRDLKPGNVLVARVDEQSVPKVIDFGIAKATHAELTQETLLTRGAQALGTPEYMAPEQASTSQLGIDTRVDIYSLGVLLYELLTGSRPFELDTTAPADIELLLTKVRDDEPSRPSTRLGLAGDATERVAFARSTSATALRRQLEGDLDWIVIRALEKERDRRYASAHDFAADVRRFLKHEAVEAVPPSATYRLRKLVRRRRKAIVAAATLLVVLVAGSIGTGIGWWNTQQSNLALQRALGEKDEALTEAEAARVAESQQRQRAQEEAARAQEESERAARAEAESAERARTLQLRTNELEERTTQLEQRTGQLEQIADFESETVGTVDATSMGIGLRAALLDEAPEDRRDGLHDALEGLNFTNLAIDTLRDNLLDTRLDAIHSRFSEQPDIRARLLGSHADSRSALGLPNEALPLHEQVVELWTDIHGPEHVETLAAVTTLARARLENGDAAGALQLIEDNLAALERVLGSDHPESVRAFDLSGMAAYGAGDMARAERVMQAGVERRLQAGEHDDLATWDAIKGLSAVLWTRGRRGEAMEMSGVALDGLRRTASTDDPKLVAAIHNRASMLAFSGELKDAEVLMLEALESERRARGDLHPTALAAAENLAILTANLGRPAEAEAMLVACLEGFREALGDAHPETLECQNSLAGFYRRQNRFAEAEPLVRNTLAAQRRLLGDDHPDVIDSMVTLDELLFYTDRIDDSEAISLQIYDITLRTKGDGHVDTSAAIRRLIGVYEAQQRVDDGVQLLRDALDRRTRDLGDDAVATRQSREDLAFFLERHGREEESQRVRDG